MKSLPRYLKKSHKKQITKRKVRTYSGGILLLIGFLIVLFTAGASDLDLIEFPQIILRVLLGVVIGGIGWLSLIRGERYYDV
jgi:UDP-N-acetylmuramyl pentapeptide phosphotransferase/UDP-N-acetylglucosamine-1-phosphate transferase